MGNIFWSVHLERTLESAQELSYFEDEATKMLVLPSVSGLAWRELYNIERGALAITSSALILWENKPRPVMPFIPLSLHFRRVSEKGKELDCHRLPMHKI